MPHTVLRLPTVKARTGLSRSTINLRVSRSALPAPVSLGGPAVGWIEAEVNACDGRLLVNRLPSRAGRFQNDIRVDLQREPLFLAADPVSPAPPPSARGTDLQVKASSVEQLACSRVLYGSLSNQVRPMNGSGTGNRTPVPWLRTTYPNP